MPVPLHPRKAAVCSPSHRDPHQFQINLRFYIPMSLALPLSPVPAYALSLPLSAAVVLLALVALGAARS